MVEGRVHGACLQSLPQLLMHSGETRSTLAEADGLAVLVPRPDAVKSRSSKADRGKHPRCAATHVLPPSPRGGALPPGGGAAGSSEPGGERKPGSEEAKGKEAEDEAPDVSEGSASDSGEEKR